MDALRSVLNNRDSPNNDEERGILSSFGDATTLSFATRVKCFIACFLLGVLFSILGSVVLFFSLVKGLPTFAVLYTLGNICSIASTMFLVKPMKQLKNIFAPTRLWASIVVLVTFILTMVAAFVLHNPLLALLMVIIQSLAMTWYSISYIPYARDAVIKILGGLCS